MARVVERGSVWGLSYDGVEGLRPVVVVSDDARNRSRLAWVDVVRIAGRDKPDLPTIVPLLGEDEPLRGRAMCDEVEMVPKVDLQDVDEYAVVLSERTMRRISRALTIVLDHE